MEPKKFNEANIVFGANQPEYKPLPAQIVKGRSGQVLTCWKLSPDELRRIQETGELWLSVLTFNQPLQPVNLSTEKPPIFDAE